MEFRNYISLILKGIPINDVERMDLEDEMLDHLEMLKKEYMEAGYAQEEAEHMAIRKFGATEEINQKFKGVYSPFTRFMNSLKPKVILKETLQWAVCIVVTFFISISINSFAFAGTEVRQSSMQNTLFEGQRLVENKLVYHYSSPKRGDIVIIDEEENKGMMDTFLSETKDVIKRIGRNDKEDQTRLIKRVIGVPGDEINIKNGKVYVNGKRLDESYAKGVTYPNSTEFPIKIPKKNYFVMGDNREVSLDSRDIGLISIGRIEGKAVLRLWPLNKIGSLTEKK